MGFCCPACNSQDLDIAAAIQLPPDSRSDDILLQEVVCVHCAFCGLAVYEESRRGSLDSDAWEHTGYRLPPEAVEDVAAQLRGCPDPFQSGCTCPAHQSLGQQDSSGRWIPPAALELGEPFSME